MRRPRIAGTLSVALWLVGCGAIVGEDFGGYHDGSCSGSGACVGTAGAFEHAGTSPGLGGADTAAGASVGGAEAGGAAASLAAGRSAQAGESAGGVLGGLSSAGATGSNTACCTPVSKDYANCCNNTCTDISKDPNNCGSCGRVCSAGRSCVADVCEGGWRPMSSPPDGFVARSQAAVVAMGQSVFFWGGLDGAGNALDDGAIYSSRTDTWTLVAKDAHTPSARRMASAVYTGNEVILYGGGANGVTTYADGASYDLVKKSWTPLPSSNAISPRIAPFASWDGQRALIFGGLNSQGGGVPGVDRFDWPNGVWSVASKIDAPGALVNSAFAAGNLGFYVAGGQIAGVRQVKAYQYAADKDSWTELVSFGLSARSSAFGTNFQGAFVMWGGRDDTGLRNDGQYLQAGNTANDYTWLDISTVGAPSPRMVSQGRAGWSFPVGNDPFAIIGGQTSLDAAAAPATDGGLYAYGQWTAIPSWPSHEDHEYGMGASIVFGDFVLWGGRNGGHASLTGERWAP